MLSQLETATGYAPGGLLLLTALAVGWFLLNRILSPWQALRLIKTELPKGMRGNFAGGLRIGTYNIAHGRGPGPYKHKWEMLGREAIYERLQQIAQLLREANLDIVVLNEVDFDSVWSRHLNQAEFIAREAGFPFRAEQRNVDMTLLFARMRYGNALLSRYPLLAVRRLPFVGRGALESILIGRKQGLLCTLELAAAHHIQVLAVHLEHRGEATRLRAAHMMEATRQASVLPLIAAGDFNSAPADFPHAMPDPHGQTAVSWLLARGAYQTLPTATPSRDDLTYWSVKPSQVIDWILVPAGWKIISKTTLPQPLSDHKAVVMEVEVCGWPGGS